MSRVMIGCPVRNRAWILPDYLQHLRALKYPQEQIEYCFVINDSFDETRAILTALLGGFLHGCCMTTAAVPEGGKEVTTSFPD